MTRKLITVRVEAGDYAGLPQHFTVPRYGVHDFHLVRPPVTETRSPGTVTGNLVCNFVALEHVLERSNLELEVIRHTNQHGNFVLPIAVAMDDSLAL